MKNLFLSLIFGLLFIFSFSNTLLENDVGDQVKIEYNQDVSDATLNVADFNFVSNGIKQNTSQNFIFNNVNYSFNLEKEVLLTAKHNTDNPRIKLNKEHINSYRNFYLARGLPS